MIRDSQGRFSYQPRYERTTFRSWLFMATRGVRIAARIDQLAGRRSAARAVCWLVGKVMEVAG